MVNRNQVILSAGALSAIVISLSAWLGFENSMAKAERLANEDCQVTCDSEGRNRPALRPFDSFNLPTGYSVYVATRNNCEADCGFPVERY